MCVGSGQDLGQQFGLRIRRPMAARVRLCAAVRHRARRASGCPVCRAAPTPAAAARGSPPLPRIARTGRSARALCHLISAPVMATSDPPRRYASSAPPRGLAEQERVALAEGHEPGDTVGAVDRPPCTRGRVEQYEEIARKKRPYRPTKRPPRRRVSSWVGQNTGKP